MKDGAFVFLFRDEARKEIFLVYRSDWPLWSITGGGIEKGETPEQAAQREVCEETGFKVKIIRPVGQKLRYRGTRPPKIAYYFEGRVVSGTFKPEFPGCRGRWFNITHLPTDFLEVNRQTIRLGTQFNGQEFVQKISRRFFLRDLVILFRHPITGIKFLKRKTLK